MAADLRKEARRLYLEGMPTAAIADLLKVCRRTIERWSNKGNWLKTRKVQEVASLLEKREESDDLEIVEIALPKIGYAFQCVTQGWRIFLNVCNVWAKWEHWKKLMTILIDSARLPMVIGAFFD